MKGGPLDPPPTHTHTPSRLVWVTWSVTWSVPMPDGEPSDCVLLVSHISLLQFQIMHRYKMRCV